MVLNPGGAYRAAVVRRGWMEKKEVFPQRCPRALREKLTNGLDIDNIGTDVSGTNFPVDGSRENVREPVTIREHLDQ